MPADGITEAIRAVLYIEAPVRPDRPWPAECCERCGEADDEPVVAMVHTTNNGVIRAHRDCGEASGHRVVSS